jgi:hypothetical protein
MTVIALRSQHQPPQAVHLHAMALNISNSDHPNKMPFSGILVRLDEPSDAAPGGANGRRIIVTAEAAERALPSLLGMAVDFTPSFDGHDAQAKIGVITSADIVGNAISISGFIYAADFPETASMIKAMKSALGFSFEAQRLTVSDPSADILTITGLAFTGAAILRKDKAAYTTTSLAASAAKTKDLKMVYNYIDERKPPTKPFPYAFGNKFALLKALDALGFTVPKELEALAASSTQALGSAGHSITVYELDQALKKVNLSVEKRLQLKAGLSREGILK